MGPDCPEKVKTEEEGGAIKKMLDTAQEWMNRAPENKKQMGKCVVTVRGETILCLSSKTTVTSARKLCVFSFVQKGTPGLTHKDCVLQRVSLGELSDVTVVLGMRQSIQYPIWNNLLVTGSSLKEE